ncbi:MAG: hypothetical protein JXB19_06975 [Bacteroidales bacterium]|nr:hypothetical protein [Bacteroidales bacterium]
MVETIADDDKGTGKKEIKITIENDTITEVVVNGEPVLPDDDEKYKDSYKTNRIEMNILDAAVDSTDRNAKETNKEIEIIIKDSDASILYKDYLNKILADIDVDPESYRKLLQEKMNISQEEMQRAQE